MNEERCRRWSGVHAGSDCFSLPLLTSAVSFFLLIPPLQYTFAETLLSARLFVKDAKLSSRTDGVPEVKVILFGNPGVGKRVIINRLFARSLDCMKSNSSLLCPSLLRFLFFLASPSFCVRSIHFSLLLFCVFCFFYLLSSSFLAPSCFPVFMLISLSVAPFEKCISNGLKRYREGDIAFTISSVPCWHDGQLDAVQEEEKEKRSRRRSRRTRDSYEKEL